MPYELNERAGWALDIEELRRAVNEARDDGKLIRGLVFINPGNPTGQCLTTENLQELIKFAYEEHIVLMADEVCEGAAGNHWLLRKRAIMVHLG